MCKTFIRKLRDFLWREKIMTEHEQQKLKGGRSIYCCIPNCGSSFYDKDGNKTGIGFFKFPTDKDRRKLWIRIVNNVRRKGAGDNFTINEYTRICQFHFNPSDIKISLGIGRKTLSPGATPVFKNSTEQKPLRRSPRKRIFLEDQDDINNNTNAVTIEPSEVDILKKQLSDLQNENEQLKQKIEKTNDKLMKQYYNFENLSGDSTVFKSETGLDLESFTNLFEFLNPGENCCNLKMYESKLKATSECLSGTTLKSPDDKTKTKSQEGKQGPQVKLDPKNQLFLYLVWLKGGFTLQHTSWLFKLSIPTVSRYIITWSNFMYFFPGVYTYLAIKKNYSRDNARKFQENLS